jgi:hypothetical protein
VCRSDDDCPAAEGKEGWGWVPDAGGSAAAYVGAGCDAAGPTRCEWAI